MARSAIGLDIGTSSVRAAEIQHGSPPTLIRFAQVSLPEGACADGEIRDPEAVGQAIKDLWKRGGFRRKQVAIAVANQKVVVRPVEVPWMEDEELRGALGFQVQEYIPIPIEDAIVDFQSLEDYTTDDGARMRRVMVVAAVTEMILQFSAAIDAAGLQLESIDYSGFSALRALAEPEGVFAAEAREAEAILDIGAGITNVVVHENGVPRFVRLLPSGAGDFTDSLVSELGMPFEEAERLKMSMGVQLDPTAAVEGASRVIERRASGFIDDVRNSLEYYQAQSGAAPLARVVVVGGGSLMPRLNERLSSALRLPVEPGTPLARVKLGKLRFSAEQLQHVSAVSAVAIGLAMEDD